MNLSLIGLILFFVGYIINRFVMTGATNRLSDADKLKIFEVFSKKNNYTMIFLLTIVVVYFGTIQYFPYLMFQITIVYLAVYIFYLIFRFITNHKKLKEMEMPADYIKSFVTSYSIFGLGTLALAICFLWSWIR